MKTLKSLQAKSHIGANLKIVILDNPELNLKNETVKRLLADIIVTRQEGYKRASGNYLSLDKLDLIGTHVLICDVSNLYSPKVISGLRLSYSDRCSNYKVKLPMDDNAKHMNVLSKKAYKEFKNNKNVVIESNSWFVDAEFSYAKTNLDLANIISTASVLFLLRQGITHFMTATNEKFKASRWVDFGFYDHTHIFDHPHMLAPHKVIMMEEFNYELIGSRVNEFLILYQNAFEVLPEGVGIKSFVEVKAEIDLKAKDAKRKKAA